MTWSCQGIRRDMWQSEENPPCVCCMWPYKATMSVVSVRSQGDEARVSESDNSRHWCGISVIPTPPTDASGDADSEPGATVKSLIKSFDTVGQSEHRAPQQKHTLTHRHKEWIPTQLWELRGQMVGVSGRIFLCSYVQLCQQMGRVLLSDNRIVLHQWIRMMCSRWADWKMFSSRELGNLSIRPESDVSRWM